MTLERQTYRALKTWNTARAIASGRPDRIARRYVRLRLGRASGRAFARWLR